MPRMPTIFIPHGGGPCFFMEWNPSDTWNRQAEYLRGIPKAIGQKPKAILIISGHWEERVVTVQTNPTPPLYFDYHGFPPHTYELTYPAPGDTNLSERVLGLLSAVGIEANTNSKRGYDHGVFIPLKVAFPDADIPIVQLSLRADLDPAAHIAIGEALLPLRDEEVLIIGSGNTYHNMGKMMRAMRGPSSGVIEGQDFDNWLSNAVCDPNPDIRNQKLANWADAPGGKDAHPREEHLLPLHVVAGAAGTDRGVKTLEDHVLGGIESAYQFG